MRDRTPTIHCDAEDGLCGSWDIDYWAIDTTSVNGVRVTESERAPGWRNTITTDYCPEHVSESE